MILKTLLLLRIKYMLHLHRFTQINHHMNLIKGNLCVLFNNLSCMLSIEFFTAKFNIQSSKQLLFASTFIILLVISALRTDIGTDYVNYVRLYNDIIHDSFVNSNVEVGFYLVVTLSNYISKEPQLMFMIMSLITLTALFSTKK